MPQQPDWRRPADYADTVALSPTLWAWQFLRRNPKYRAAWNEALARYREQSLPDPPFPSDPDDDDFRMPVEPAWQAAAEWGLHELVNPDHPAPTRLGFRRPGSEIPILQRPADSKGWGWEQFTKPHAVTARLAGNHVALAFDLALPINPQLTAAERHLRWLQEQFDRAGILRPSRPKRNRKDWPKYLRALDARAAGASLVEIAGVLFPHRFATLPPRPRLSRKRQQAQRAAKELLRQARQMAKPDGYLLLRPW